MVSVGLSLRRSCGVFLFSAALVAPLAAQSQQEAAGTIGLLNGQAQVAGAGTPAHALAKGDSIYNGDTVQTGASSYAMIRFSDQSTALLRPNTSFLVEKYHYAAAAPAPAASAPSAQAPLQVAAAPVDSSFFRLVKGGFRAVSGLIAHADYSHYGVATPVATMGVRGTDYELVMCESACQADSTVLESLPPGENPAGGVVSGVNSGSIEVVSFTGHTMTLTAGQYGITLADGTQYLLRAIPAFLENGAAAASGGVAAGGADAAAGAAGGSALATAGVAVGIAALVGVIVGGSSDESSHSTTSTSTTGTSSTGR